jgi:hypothetical protein
LPFVGGDDLRIAEFPSGAIGTQDKAGLRVLGLLYGVGIRMDLRLAVPRARLAGRAQCGTAFASVTFVFRQRRRRTAVILPVRGQDRQGLVSGLGGATALGLEVKELLGDGLVFALGGFLQRGLRTLQSRLGIHYQPTLDQPLVAQGQRWIAGAGIHRLPGVPLARLADDLRYHLAGGRNPGDQAQLGKMDGIIRTGELGISDEIAWAGRALEGAYQRLSPRLENPGG